MRRCLLLLIALLVATPALAARITGLAITPGVVTVTADGPPAVAWQLALDAPYRLVIDMPAVIDQPLRVDGAGSVTAMRAAQFQPGVARLVLDLAGPLEILSARNSATGLTITLGRVPQPRFDAAVARGRIPLPVLSGGEITATPPAPAAPGFELPADIFAKTPPPPAAIPVESPPQTARLPELSPQITPAGPETTPAPPRPARAQGVRPRSGGKPLVVIDAGHGGKDVGAISVNGGYEKNVTLAIARAAAKALEKNGKVRVKLTRSDDRFIPLGGRVTIARNARADLFISIHADAAGNAAARGASVYTLSAVASDAVAARLAARENKSDIIGGVNLGLEAPEVGEIMIDLSRRATGNVSVAFADILQDSLSSAMKFRAEFHHFAGFHVLKAPDVPSVLLETGYVTNTDDARFLFSEKGQRRVASGIARAIERHLLGD